MAESDDRLPISISLRRTGEERARERAEAQARRSAERAEMAQSRADRRSAEREQASREREARRGTGLTSTVPDPPSRRTSERDQPAPKRRASGSLRRTGEIRVERDTRNFKTVVDARRIRELARRGAQVDGLATVFKMSVEEIEAILAGDETSG